MLYFQSCLKSRELSFLGDLINVVKMMLVRIPVRVGLDVILFIAFIVAVRIVSRVFFLLDGP